jgi:hypothetical protein
MERQAGGSEETLPSIYEIIVDDETHLTGLHGKVEARGRRNQLHLKIRSVLPLSVLSTSTLYDL